MAPQQKEFLKSIGWMITAGIFVVGLIFGAGKLVEGRSTDRSQIIHHEEEIQNHEVRLQTLETSKAVQETDSKNMKESLVRIEQNSEETKRLVLKLLTEKQQ